jgi:OmpA-OmpF porin, OOP family
MSFNLLEMVKNYFTSQFVNHASSILGENPSGISNALTAVIPVSLAGILYKATSGTEGANDVYQIAQNSVGNVSGTSDLNMNQNLGEGTSMMTNFFGANQTAIMNGISRYSGIKESSSSSLMSMALPPVMGILGNHAQQNNLSASGLAGFLSSQKDHIMQAMPSGLSSLNGLLGLGSPISAASNNSSNITDSHTHVDDIKTISERPTGKWLVPLIVILVVIALLWYFSRSCNAKTKPSPATNYDSTSMIVNATTNNV